MRIISSFHDYYDAVQAAGQDQTLIYNRIPKEVKVRRFPFPVLRVNSWDFECTDRELLIRQHIIGFCGKIHPAMILTHVPSKKTTVCYRVEDVDTFIESDFCEHVREQYSKGRWHKRRYKRDTPRRKVAEHFSECLARRDSFAEIFLNERCPVFVGILLRPWRRRDENEGKIIYNGCLKELEFFRIFDT